jgi:hypothetical protein
LGVICGVMGEFCSYKESWGRIDRPGVVDR